MIEQVCLVILMHIAQREAPVDSLHMHPHTYQAITRGRILVASHGHELCGVLCVFDPKMPPGAVQARSHHAGPQPAA